MEYYVHVCTDVLYSVLICFRKVIKNPHILVECAVVMSTYCCERPIKEGIDIDIDIDEKGTTYSVVLCCIPRFDF